MTKKTTLTCGLIMPISPIDGCSAQHWEEVRAIIQEALMDTEFTIRLVSDSDDVGVIQKRIVQNIYDNDIVICDVSAKNPNVMFELGMRLAFDKPAIIIKDYETQYSFDTAPVEHLEYPRNLHYSSIQAFKLKLKEKVTSTYEAAKNPNYTTFLKHFGTFVVAKVDEKTVGRDEFLLAAISDLKSDFKSLSKSVRSVDHSSAKSVVDATSTTQLDARGFLLGKIIDKKLDIQALRSSPDLQKKLFEEFLNSIIPFGAPTYEQYNFVKKGFTDELYTFFDGEINS